MKKRYTSILVSLFSISLLVGCGSNGGGAQPATYTDATKNSIYGKLYDFDKTTVSAGDTLTFKVKPSQYFFVESVTNNGQKCRKVYEDPETHICTYSTVIQPGKNKLAGKYFVDSTVDFVSEFKLDIGDDIFEEVMKKKQTGAGQGVATDLDFRRSGIEQVRAPCTWQNGTKVSSSSIDSNYFINYVDGDTTHVETFNLNYTVKIRYLSIDTPESTSEIEEWGLSASYFSKYIFSGEEEYWNKIKDSFPNGKQGIQAGASSLILVSKDLTINADKATKADLKLGSKEKGPYCATTDGNQRNLAYVWYSTKENPTKNDFRCLNLEMVYQGFSNGVGSSKDTSEKYYRIFDAANLSAKANGRHLYSLEEETDKNYYYYKTKEIKEKTLKEIYDSIVTKDDPDIGYLTDSPLANKKTLYKVRGYVSRKLKTAFYIQDKPSYDNAKVISGEEKPYGLYIFTYAENSIKEGDYVECVGALSEYGGTLQMQGLEWKDGVPDPVYNRNTTIISSGHTMVPVKLTGAQFNALKLPSILVSIVDNVWFYDFKDTNGSIAEGGSHEVNKYNTSYPFYNTSNAPIFWGSFGETDNTAELAALSSVRYDDRSIRFTVDQDIELEYTHDVTGVVEHENTYKFFVGGEHSYNIDITKRDDPTDPNTFTYTFKRKTAYYNSETDLGIIVISHGYQSTGNKRKMNAKICRATDVILTEMAG